MSRKKADANTHQSSATGVPTLTPPETGAGGTRKRRRGRSSFKVEDQEYGAQSSDDDEEEQQPVKKKNKPTTKSDTKKRRRNMNRTTAKTIRSFQETRAGAQVTDSNGEKVEFTLDGVITLNGGVLYNTVHSVSAIYHRNYIDVTDCRYSMSSNSESDTDGRLYVGERPISALLLDIRPWDAFCDEKSATLKQTKNAERKLAGTPEPRRLAPYTEEQEPSHGKANIANRFKISTGEAVPGFSGTCEWKRLGFGGGTPYNGDRRSKQGFYGLELFLYAEMEDGIYEDLASRRSEALIV